MRTFTSSFQQLSLSSLYFSDSLNSSIYISIKGDKNMDKILLLLEHLFIILFNLSSWFLGSFDEKFKVLITMVAIEFVTLFLVAIYNRKPIFSFINISLCTKKTSIFIIIGIANLIDMQISGNCDLLRSAALVFYITYQGIIALDTISYIIPIPKKLKEALKILRGNEPINKDNTE